MSTSFCCKLFMMAAACADAMIIRQGTRAASKLNMGRAQSTIASEFLGMQALAKKAGKNGANGLNATNGPQATPRSAPGIATLREKSFPTGSWLADVSGMHTMMKAARSKPTTKA